MTGAAAPPFLLCSRQQAQAAPTVQLLHVLQERGSLKAPRACSPFLIAGNQWPLWLHHPQPAARHYALEWRDLSSLA